MKSLKSFIRNKVIAKQGGETISTLLREITKKENHVSVGLFSYGGCFEKTFNLGGTVSIKNYCSFGTNIKYFGANHPFQSFSMSPFFYKQAWADKWGGGKRIGCPT